MVESSCFPQLDVTFTVLADKRGFSLAIKPLTASMEDYLTTGELCDTLNSATTVEEKKNTPTQKVM